MTNLKLTVRAIVFSLLIPGTVGGLIPHLLSSSYPYTIDLGSLRYSGIVLIGVGLIFYLASLLRFVIEGRGTPAIWFTRKLRSVIGEEPTSLVTHGIYLYSRNPMYLGVLSVVAGTGVLRQSPVVMTYAVFLFVAFHCVVVFIEEPHLRKKFGASYESYLVKVSRWFGKRPERGVLS